MHLYLILLKIQGTTAVGVRKRDRMFYGASPVIMCGAAPVSTTITFIPDTTNGTAMILQMNIAKVYVPSLRKSVS
jgi:hypothetical protein